ncbi:MAG: hypothetical protein K8S55_00685 [Phycisphaerae bacterium]|nr:hypothetical protein [Phycisphaerae bacterium]
MNQLFKEFTTPGSEYRGKPFWAWNGKLDPEELRWQIRIMQRMGLGGFFMHSRVGLDTEYLSEDWFKCVEACVDEADKCNMEAWLYDEDRWPSGAAGGLITKNPKYRMRSVAMDELTNPRDVKWTAETLAVFTAKVKGTEASNVKRVAKGKTPKPAAGESILVFHVQSAPLSSWYNGYTYLDVLSHEAVGKFIEVTHEAYRKRIGEHFGKVVPGIFTDEPNHGAKFSRIQDTNPGNNVPWTAKLPAIFKKRYGYDILAHLPKLFLDVDGEGVTPARLNYHDCVTFLFSDAFARQIGQWCEKNNMAHTGHLLMEESLRMQACVVGSCMRFYEYMQAPGMDLLTEYHREYDTAKQLSSAARQFGRKWRLTETYGCTGWDFPFAGHKALGDWQAALGINLRCQHLSWYTMEGEAKRDYPAGILHQSPWWELYSTVEDYFARIHATMTKGQEVRDLLVIHPIESVWMYCKKGWLEGPEAKKYDSVLPDIRDDLLAANIDFDYCDEDILARHGKVAGKAGPALVIGKAKYKAVVVPPLVTIRETTLNVLKRFAAAGGTVIFAGKPAGYVDAVASKAAVDFAKDCVKTPAKGKALVAAVEPISRRVSITNAAGEEIIPTLHLLREDKDAFYLFVCNTGHDFRGKEMDTRVLARTAAFEDVRIRGFAGCTGSPMELDPQTGQVFAADAKGVAGGWEIRTSLPAIGSRLFVIPKKASRKALPKRRKLKDVSVKKLAPQKWDVAMSECNNLVLDRPQYKIGAGKARQANEILRVDKAVRDAIGLAHRGGAMVQPWAREKSENPKNIPLELSYTFDAAAIPSGDLFLGLERPELYRMQVNGTEVSVNAESGWWTDKSLRRIPVAPSLLRVGQNEIKLFCDYDENHPGLEIVYLLGNFGTKVRGTDVAITKPPAGLKLGDWGKQGLAFYSGSVSYLRTISPKLRKSQRLFVQVPAYRGAAVRVLVNGKSAGMIGWDPCEVDITDLIDSDKAQLAVEVIGHRRNSHGPLHQRDKTPIGVGPANYTTTGDDWIDSYNLVPCGLMEPPRLIIRQ